MFIEASPITYLLSFTIVPLDINALGPMMFKHCYPITIEGGILVLKELFHTTYDLNIII